MNVITSVDFIERTGEMWTYLCSYANHSGYGKLPFRYTDLQNHLLKYVGKEDGMSQCPYCNGFFTVEYLMPGYAIPLTRGGRGDLSLIEFCCNKCHEHKGQLTPEEYYDLLKFIEVKISLRRKDILNKDKTKAPVG